MLGVVLAYCFYFSGFSFILLYVYFSIWIIELACIASGKKWLFFNLESHCIYMLWREYWYVNDGFSCVRINRAFPFVSGLFFFGFRSVSQFSKIVLAQFLLSILSFFVSILITLYLLKDHLVFFYKYAFSWILYHASLQNLLVVIFSTYSVFSRCSISLHKNIIYFSLLMPLNAYDC